MYMYIYVCEPYYSIVFITYKYISYHVSHYIRGYMQNEWASRMCRSKSIIIIITAFRLPMRSLSVKFPELWIFYSETLRHVFNFKGFYKFVLILVRFKSELNFDSKALSFDLCDFCVICVATFMFIVPFWLSYESIGQWKV